MSGPMEVRENEVLLIYNSEDLQNRRTLAYAKSTQHQVKEFDVQKEVLTQLQIEELSDRLNTNPLDLIDKESTTYQKEYKEVELDRDGALKALRKNPSIMKTPIAVYHDSAEFVSSSYSFVKRDMAIRGKSE